MKILEEETKGEKPLEWTMEFQDKFVGILARSTEMQILKSSVQLPYKEEPSGFEELKKSWAKSLELNLKASKLISTEEPKKEEKDEKPQDSKVETHETDKPKEVTDSSAVKITIVIPEGKKEVEMDAWKFKISDIVIDWSHILPEKLKQLEVCELKPIEESANDILKIAEKTEFSNELLGLWKGFFQNNNVFSNAQHVRSNLVTVVDYCESGLSTPLCKQQLRYVCRELKKCPDNGVDAASVLAIISAHG